MRGSVDWRFTPFTLCFQAKGGGYGMKEFRRWYERRCSVESCVGTTISRGQVVPASNRLLSVEKARVVVRLLL